MATIPLSVTSTLTTSASTPRTVVVNGRARLSSIISVKADQLLIVAVRVHNGLLDQLVQLSLTQLCHGWLA